MAYLMDFKTCFFDHKKQSIEQGLGGPFSIQFKKFTYERYIFEKQVTIQNFASGIFGGCIGCPSLIKKKGFFPNELVKKIDFAFFSTCNLTCIYCPLGTWYKHKISDYYKDVLNIVDSLIVSKKVDPFATITFSGGEPTLIPQLSDLCKMFLNYSQNISFVFLTNGVIFSDVISSLIKDGVNINICISLDSGNRERYLEIKGKDSFNQVITNIRKYSDLGSSENFKIRLKFIILEENVDQIPQFISLCKQLQIREIMYDVDFLSELNDRILSGIDELQRLANINNLICCSPKVGSQ